jgi:hypothetical protein
MEVQPDFRGLLALLNAHKVDYMIVGAYALAFHGPPRYTGNIAISVKPDEVNAQCIMAALDEFGLGRRSHRQSTRRVWRYSCFLYWT